MIQKKVTDFFALEGNYPDLDGEGAAARLSAAIRCKTINYFDHSRTDYTEFDKLHAHIKASYPNIMRVGTFERIGHHAVLITIPGSDASLRPCLYMSHQDVVPVVEGTEQDWTHPAFSGDIADGYIWGRGTLDIKEQVFGVLEAAEYLLARGKSFARTAYLAFGDDEETINLGALAIAEHLKAQGVTLEFVLDEGGCKIEPGTAFGAPETSIVSVQLMEKGYADLELSVHSIGGHSSRPYGGTSLGRLSGAIADITRAPFAVRLNSAMTGAFETLAPYKNARAGCCGQRGRHRGLLHGLARPLPVCHHHYRAHDDPRRQRRVQCDAAGHDRGHQLPLGGRRHGRERHGPLPRGRTGQRRRDALFAGQRSLRHRAPRRLRLPHSGRELPALLSRSRVHSLDGRGRDGRAPL